MLRLDIKEQFKDGLARKVGWDPERSVWAHITDAQLKQMLIWLEPPENKKVLDIGIASGRFVRELSKHKANTYGVDISPLIIQEVQQAMDELELSVRLFEGDAENLPFEDNFFDAVNCQQVLLHLPNQATALSEMCRVLKPEGSLVVDITNRHGPYSLYRHYFKRIFMGKIREIFFGKKDISSNTVNMRTYREFKQLINTTPLEIREIKGYGFVPPMGRLVPRGLSKFFTSRLDPRFGNIFPSRSSFIMARLEKPERQTKH